MKSLVPWMCIVFTSASQTIFAHDDFHAYRLGNYHKASESLISRSGKSPIADYYLARLYLYGYGELRNTDLAMRYFTKSADQGYLPAIMVMAKYALFKENNPELAVTWFKKAAAAGDVSAQMFMAAAYLYGIGVKAHEDVATKYYIDAARNGNSIAQFTLAEHFINSRQSGNNKLGVIWLNKAVANGNVKAQAKLGGLYISGKLVTKDMTRGLGLLKNAAAQNNTQAMLDLGDLALTQQDYPLAIKWYNKAVALNDPEAFLHLGHAYLQEKSPIFNANAGYLWILKAAQADIAGAKSDLAKLYEKGIGVEADADMAKQWALLAAQDGKKKSSMSALNQAALWLSNGASNALASTAYQMNGIFSAWQNPAALKNNVYNQAPKMEFITRSEIFKPEFALIQPNEVPIANYYQALISKNDSDESRQWTYPGYRFSKEIEALQKENSMVVNKQNLPAPLVDANYFNYEENSGNLMDRWTQGWQKQANYMAAFNPLYFRAILGDAYSQFEIGQMFHYGVGIPQNFASAIVFYQNAAEQQHLGAEYNLGLLYLQHPQDANSYQLALNWLTDAAFKGNSKSLYVLSRVLEHGKIDADGKYVIKSNHEQAQSMLYLAAAKGYGLAEFDLAENLARQSDNALSIEVRKHKIALIRQLFLGASEKGIVEAVIPLAFYNAEDQDLKLREKAFTVAKSQAESGDDNAALLLGLLYDRGVGVIKNPAQAVAWYQRAEKNQVSQFILGTYTAEGNGITKDRTQGMVLLKNSADRLFSYADFNLAALKQQAGKEFLPDLVTAYNLGNAHAGIVLADYYLSENNDLEKVVQAQQIYTRLAEKGDETAELKLGFMLDRGLGGTPDLAAAQHWYTESATQGNPLAQFMLGRLYQVGENSEPDYTLAKEWYQKAASKLPQASIALGFINETVEDNYLEAFKAYEQAASKGDARGIYNLALMYLYGKGVPVDFSKAKMLLNEASKKGLHEAMNQVADLYFNGLGQPQDKEQAQLWYKKAADSGSSNALYQLGLLSEVGIATKPDISAAMQYYKKAADKGNEKAMLALARIYHDGNNTQKDIQASVNIWQKLAGKQNPYAQYRLGTIYMEGTAGERSVNKGRQLLKLASDNGSVQASIMLQRMEAQTQPNVSFIQPLKSVDKLLH